MPQIAIEPPAAATAGGGVEEQPGAACAVADVRATVTSQEPSRGECQTPGQQVEPDVVDVHDPRLRLREVFVEAGLLIGGPEPGLYICADGGATRRCPYSCEEERVQGLPLLTKGMECSFRLRRLGLGLVLEEIMLTGLHEVHGASPGDRIRERSQPVMVARLRTPPVVFTKSRLTSPPRNGRSRHPRSGGAVEALGPASDPSGVTTSPSLNELTASDIA